MLSRLNIGQRLGAGFALVLALSLIAIAVAVANLAQVAADTRAMMSEPLAKERLIHEWASNIASGVRRNSAIAMSNEPDVAAFDQISEKLARRVVGEADHAGLDHKRGLVERVDHCPFIVAKQRHFRLCSGLRLISHACPGRIFEPCAPRSAFRAPGEAGLERRIRKSS